MAEYPFILGTAGHIDHGKTTLVRRLTGVDCDRLFEEKKRGITIELGFAPLTLSDNTIVSVIDVPGHERFIRQMVAGAAGVDAVLLVVASDEGIMPQTREHLAILNLLGIKKGIVVLTKKDLVEEDFLEIVIDDVVETCKDTFLQGSPIIPVSASTGEGLDVLRKAIEILVSSSEIKNKEGAFFLPIDRVFHVTGFGSIITGTAYRGQLNEGDEVELLPAGFRSKVRSIQVHGCTVMSAVAGQRMAVNIPSISLEQIHRGDVLCIAGSYESTNCLDVQLKLLRENSDVIKHWQRVRVHVGSAETIARVVLIEGRELKPGQTSYVQLITEEPLVISYGERFIIRSYSPVETIGGGVVLFPYARKISGAKSRQEKLLFLENLSQSKGFSERILLVLSALEVMSVSRLLMLAQMEKKTFEQHLSSLESKGRVLVLRASERTVISLKKAESLWEAVEKKLAAYHKAHPELTGASVEELASALPSFELKGVREYLFAASNLGWCKAKDDRYYLNDFEYKGEGSFNQILERTLKKLDECAFQLVHVDSLSAIVSLSNEEVSRIITYFKESKDAKLIGDGYILTRTMERRFYDALQGLEGDITVAALRDATGSSRKFTLSLLEYFDSQGLTRRVGDKRVLLKKTM